MSRRIEISNAAHDLLCEYKEHNDFPYTVTIQLAVEEKMARDKKFQAWRKKKAGNSVQESKAPEPAPKSPKAKSPEPETESAVAPKPRTEEPPPPRSTGYNSTELK